MYVYPCKRSHVSENRAAVVSMINGSDGCTFVPESSAAANYLPLLSPKEDASEHNASIAAQTN
eukprot:913199-Amphidinium_carterae.1